MSIINIEHSIVSKVNFPKFSLTVTKLAKVPEFSLDKVPGFSLDVLLQLRNPLLIKIFLFFNVANLHAQGTEDVGELDPIIETKERRPRIRNIYHLLARITRDSLDTERAWDVP